jgi:hypothetical protein
MRGAFAPRLDYNTSEQIDAGRDAWLILLKRLIHTASSNQQKTPSFLGATG